MSLDNVVDFYKNNKNNKNNKIEIAECSICLENLETNIAILVCNHRFHFKCIQQWYWKKRKLMCPFCQCDSEIINIKNDTASWQPVLLRKNPHHQLTHIFLQEQVRRQEQQQQRQQQQRQQQQRQQQLQPQQQQEQEPILLESQFDCCVIL